MASVGHVVLEEVAERTIGVSPDLLIFRNGTVLVVSNVGVIKVTTTAGVICFDLKACCLTATCAVNSKTGKCMQGRPEVYE
jgi:hypothetical protein